tara:strand:- start:4104 stop:4271 length:168 start_codon:yes stop_codon:yes gene_type:complete
VRQGISAQRIGQIQSLVICSTARFVIEFCLECAKQAKLAPSLTDKTLGFEIDSVK